jgi:hypothetical protein
VPKDLQRRVATLLEQRRAMRWDAALAEVVGEPCRKRKKRS